MFVIFLKRHLSYWIEVLLNELILKRDYICKNLFPNEARLMGIGVRTLFLGGQNSTHKAWKKSVLYGRGS